MKTLGKNTAAPMTCKCGQRAGPTGLCNDCFLGMDTSRGSITQRACVHGISEHRVCLSCNPWRRMWL